MFTIEDADKSGSSRAQEVPLNQGRDVEEVGVRNPSDM